MPHARYQERALRTALVALGAIVFGLLANGCAPGVATQTQEGALASLQAPVRVWSVERQTLGGVARGIVATIDLSAPGLQVIVTAPPRGARVGGRAVNAVLEPVDTWAARVGADLAINANYFGGVGRLDDGWESGEFRPTEAVKPNWVPTSGANLIGLSVSNGQMVSPPRRQNDRWDPAVIVRRDGTALVSYISPEDTIDAVAGVAGVGGSDTEPSGVDAGTLLVRDGRNLGSTARVQPAARHPRTGLGVSADGRTLVVAVIDGRRPGHSVGVTLPELAELMIELGAHNAVNLDGGGSSAIAVKDPGEAGVRVLNQPSDGRVRPVANHLGVRLKQGLGGVDWRG